ncbi:MAG: preprotein translocase subunit SecG [Thermoanaerobaculia bacterium]
MLYVFYSVHVLISLFLILVVLLQQGKGADLSVFGGGNTMTAFGARGAATLLHRLTVYGFVGFIVTTLSIGIIKVRQEGSSVMSDEDVSLSDPVADEIGDEGALSEEDLAEEDEVPLVGALEEAEEPQSESSADDPDAGGEDPGGS